MVVRRFTASVLVALSGASVVAASCGGDDDTHPPPKGCTVKDQLGCPSGQRCEEVEGSDPACFDPVVVHGTVLDISNEQPIYDARVMARDETGAAISDVALSNSDGTYNLEVPAKRDGTGAPLPRTFTVRVEARDYQAFPKAPRSAPILDVKDAKGPPYMLADATTDIAMLHLADTKSLGLVSGIIQADDPGGTLVVVAGQTGVADLDGNFVVYNVPPGQTKVNAYKQGINFDVATINVMPDSETPNVMVASNMANTATVTGNVTFVDPKGAAATTVSLALEDTFDATLVRGEIPPGLEAVNVAGGFAIAGVPDGKYVVLTAFDDDRLVHDPNTANGAAQIVHLEIANGVDQAIPNPLRAVGALAVVSPGANGVDAVSGTPTFTWEADPASDSYTVQVFDAFGTNVWELTGMFDQGSGMPASVGYAGPPLESGMLYQFRATSLASGTRLTSTEDLTGVFLYQ